MVNKSKVEKVLKEIPDPELGISIWDLGLIYGIKIEKGKVKIIMTLTTMGCPLFDQIAGPVKKKIGELSGVDSVEIELTFDPPWDVEKMSEGPKEELGF
jgi:metal-sulfur cluster biosynthetic enzyme